MSKYSTEFKLQVVKYSYDNVARRFNISNKSSVLRLVGKYKENGYEGLIKNRLSSYSGKFKQDVIELTIYHVQRQLYV